MTQDLNRNTKQTDYRYMTLTKSLRYTFSYHIIYDSQQKIAFKGKREIKKFLKQSAYSNFFFVLFKGHGNQYKNVLTRPNDGLPRYVLILDITCWFFHTSRQKKMMNVYLECASLVLWHLIYAFSRYS